MPTPPDSVTRHTVICGSFDFGYREQGWEPLIYFLEVPQLNWWNRLLAVPVLEPESGIRSLAISVSELDCRSRFLMVPVPESQNTGSNAGSNF